MSTTLSAILFVEKLVTLTVAAGHALENIAPIVGRMIDRNEITQEEVDQIIASAHVSDQRFDDLLRRLSSSPVPSSE